MRVAVKRSIENDFWTAISTAIDAAATPGKARVYDGPVPARAAAPSGNLLMEFTLPKPCAASISNGILTLNPVMWAQVAHSGSPSFVRFVDGDGVYVMDLDAGKEDVQLSDGTLPGFKFDKASYSAGEYAAPVSIVIKSPV